MMIVDDEFIMLCGRITFVFLSGLFYVLLHLLFGILRVLFRTTHLNEAKEIHF